MRRGRHEYELVESDTVVYCEALNNGLPCPHGCICIKFNPKKVEFDVCELMVLEESEILEENDDGDEPVLVGEESLVGDPEDDGDEPVFEGECVQ